MSRRACCPALTEMVAGKSLGVPMPGRVSRVTRYVPDGTAMAKLPSTLVTTHQVWLLPTASMPTETPATGADEPPGMGPGVRPSVTPVAGGRTVVTEPKIIPIPRDDCASEDCPTDGDCCETSPWVRWSGARLHMVKTAARVSHARDRPRRWVATDYLLVRSTSLFLDDMMSRQAGAQQCRCHQKRDGAIQVANHTRGFDTLIRAPRGLMPWEVWMSEGDLGLCATYS